MSRWTENPLRLRSGQAGQALGPVNVPTTLLHQALEFRDRNDAGRRIPRCVIQSVSTASACGPDGEVHLAEGDRSVPLVYITMSEGDEI